MTALAAARNDVALIENYKFAPKSRTFRETGESLKFTPFCRSNAPLHANHGSIIARHTAFLDTNVLRHNQWSNTRSLSRSSIRPFGMMLLFGHPLFMNRLCDMFSNISSNRIRAFVTDPFLSPHNKICEYEDKGMSSNNAYVCACFIVLTNLTNKGVNIKDESAPVVPVISILGLYRCGNAPGRNGYLNAKHAAYGIIIDEGARSEPEFQQSIYLLAHILEVP